ncbi:FAD-dependent oxidoreductase [Amycolatopsis antarctica]|uniref:FAD-dependent oxidoreductase n=1 Tax=Amycolatopsis antarctica TaxID=1854586 RepID=A0A263D232_9PSEU|nr:FAD-dependent oxidoreductase [Amycolatopsis antarctica]OZM71697.1 FAD-dependent oxidoreductase [Amycolatopsis antarctica]
MPEPQRVVIVGSGLAGATAAGALRERGYTGEVVVLGEEGHDPYELPALSKGVLTGEADEPDRVHEAGFYARHDIDLRLGVPVTRIELGARVVHDGTGERHGYDRLLLATGSRPRSLPVPGGDLPGLRTLRTVDDSLSLRAALRGAGRVVIAGAGWIGTEAAAAARGHGAEVTVVDNVSLPLRDVLGERVAGVFRDLHAEKGVSWRLGTGVVEFTGTPDAVTGVRLDDGTELPADVVVVAVGAAPRADLGHLAGLEIADDGGLCTDAGLRTAAPDVYAAGDVAAHYHPRYGRRVRVEHWANAQGQGEHVAGNLLGAHDPYTAAPYFFSDQYDPETGGIGCEYRGLADPGTDRLVVRGDLTGREFIAFWTRAGTVRAALNVNLWDDGDALQRLVEEDVRVTEDELVRGDLGSLG